MKKLILLLLFIPLISLGQGLIPSSVEDYNNILPVKYDDQFGITSSIPDFFSLEKFVPNVKSQGESNACTGFSVFYYGLSTQFNAELNLTNSVDKTGHSFDPYFGYNIINDENYEYSEQCDATNTMIEVLEVLKSKGAKKQFYTPHIECNSSSEKLLNSTIDNYTEPYAVFDYNRIPGIGLNISINSTKDQLLKNNPVLLATWVPNNFQYNVSSEGQYSPTDLELNTVKNILSRRNNLTQRELDEFIKNHFGHALTIIGYNDDIYGGSFRVVNSWGDQWGDNGYFWLRYKDFKILAYEAYVTDPIDDINPNSVVEFSSNNYIRMNLKDGATYEGEYIDGKFNGKGIFSYNSENGRVNVIGNWKNNLMDGFFSIVTSNNELYYGVYKNGEYVEDNSYGLTDDDDEAKKNKEKFLEYWEKHGGKKKIRKSRSIIIKQRKAT